MMENFRRRMRRTDCVEFADDAVHSAIVAYGNGGYSLSVKNT